MRYEREFRNAKRREGDILAAWEIYVMALAGLTIYSLVSAFA